MHFDFTDDQNTFRSSLRRMLEAMPVLSDRMQAGTAEAALPRHGEIARQLAELGVPGILVSEETGGVGLGFVEAVIAATEFGRAALTFPGTEFILGTAAVAMTHPDEAAALIEGTETATCVLDGRLRRRDGRLVGSLVAPYAASARWLVAAIDDDTAAVIDLTGAGLSVRSQPSLDLTQLFARVTIDLPEGDAPLVAFPLEAALRLMGCAEMAGAARHCLELAVDYLKTRTQFGQLIGKNQALRHMAASDALDCDTMEISVEYAAWAMDMARGGGSEAATEADQALCAARAGCADAARTVAEHSVQLHGGIGFTWEYGLHLPFRRIARLAAHFGGVMAEQERLASQALAACAVVTSPSSEAAAPRLALIGSK